MPSDFAMVLCRPGCPSRWLSFRMWLGLQAAPVILPGHLSVSLATSTVAEEESGQSSRICHGLEETNPGIWSYCLCQRELVCQGRREAFANTQQDLDPGGFVFAFYMPCLIDTDCVLFHKWSLT